MEKNIRDQVIEGVYDGDTVEDLSVQANLSQGNSQMSQQRDSKKYRSDIAASESEVVATVCHSPQASTNHTPLACPIAQDVDQHKTSHGGGRRQCTAYNRTCAHCHKVGHFAKVCRSRVGHFAKVCRRPYRCRRKICPQENVSGGHIFLGNSVLLDDVS